DDSSTGSSSSPNKKSRSSNYTYSAADVLLSESSLFLNAFSEAVSLHQYNNALAYSELAQQRLQELGIWFDTAHITQTEEDADALLKKLPPSLQPDTADEEDSREELPPPPPAPKEKLKDVVSEIVKEVEEVGEEDEAEMKEFLKEQARLFREKKRKAAG
ncbi:hypothetical protein TeGR_g12376, partial [Tetraparma gracilis]